LIEPYASMKFRKKVTPPARHMVEEVYASMKFRKKVIPIARHMVEEVKHHARCSGSIQLPACRYLHYAKSCACFSSNVK
jgi:hypothetical protein